LTILAFVAVIREGVETALFLVGQANAARLGSDTGALSVLLGAVAGLAIAAGLGYGFYQGSRRVNLSTFFRWTGIALIFIAAGLVSHAVHELVDAGVITIGTATLFDSGGLLSEDGLVGMLLRALFGYTSSPEVVTFVSWAAYLAIVLPLYLRPVKARPAQPIEQRVTEVAPGA
jgi:high-affinity iron transporter